MTAASNTTGRKRAATWLHEIVVLAAFALISTAGCAKIAEPQPPQIRVPKPATDLRARQRSDSVMLTFSMPSQNTDGSPVTALKKVDVYRSVESLSQGESRTVLPDEQLIKQAALILSIPAARFSDYLQGQTFVVEDRIGAPEDALMNSFALRYAVLFVNKKNQAAGFSNQVLIKPVQIPLPPSDLAAEVTENFIHLTWHPPLENMDGSKPARIVGYNIYRWEEPGKLPATPLNSDPVMNPMFEDRNFQFGKTYFYAVSILANLQEPHAESRLSDAIKVAARDTFPPLPPGNFAAIFDGKDVVLLWNASPSKDVAGYRIYRMAESSNVPQALEKELISTLRYRDNYVDLKSRYSIVAVDQYGNESSPVTTTVEVQ